MYLVFYASAHSLSLSMRISNPTHHLSAVRVRKNNEWMVILRSFQAVPIYRRRKRGFSDRFVRECPIINTQFRKEQPIDGPAIILSVLYSSRIILLIGRHSRNILSETPCSRHGSMEERSITFCNIFINDRAYTTCDLPALFGIYLRASYPSNVAFSDDVNGKCYGRYEDTASLGLLYTPFSSRSNFELAFGIRLGSTTPFLFCRDRTTSLTFWTYYKVYIFVRDMAKTRSQATEQISDLWL
jgi:hypothetical protein